MTTNTIKLHPHQIAAVEAIKKMGPRVVMDWPYLGGRGFIASNTSPQVEVEHKPMILSPAARAIGVDILERGQTLQPEQFAERMRAFFAEHDKQTKG